MRVAPAFRTKYESKNQEASSLRPARNSVPSNVYSNVNVQVFFPEGLEAQLTCQQDPPIWAGDDSDIQVVGSHKGRRR